MEEFSRGCVGQLADVAISVERVSRYLGELINAREKPGAIVCDNGTEFTANAMFFWSKDNQVGLRFIQPGKPT
jgi:putative transposase